MKRKHDYVAFFDLDGTLLKVNSGAILIRRAHQAGLIGSCKMLHAVYLSFLYKFGIIETTKIVAQLPVLLAGISEKVMAEFCEKIFKQELIRHIRPQMITEIERHRGSNARLVILSATMPYICIPLARHLQFDDIICSHMEIVDGRFSGKAQGPLCVHNEKSARLLEYCSKHNFQTDNAWFYGDSIEDLPALKAVGNPVCVNPDKKLAHSVVDGNWQIYYWE